MKLRGEPEGSVGGKVRLKGFEEGGGWVEPVDCRGFFIFLRILDIKVE